MKVRLRACRIVNEGSYREFTWNCSVSMWKQALFRAIVAQLNRKNIPGIF
jgi:hypothetical protein